jgi:hypothetical protein
MQVPVYADVELPFPGYPPVLNGIVSAQWAQSFAPGQNTMSADYVASGVYLDAVALSETDRFEIDIAGKAGHSTGSTHIQMIVKRDAVSMVPVGAQQNAAPFVISNSMTADFSIMLNDAPGAIGIFRYELFWKSYGGGSAYLGRRASDAAIILVPTTIRIRRFTQ